MLGRSWDRTSRSTCGLSWSTVFHNRCYSGINFELCRYGSRRRNGKPAVRQWAVAHQAFTVSATTQPVSIIIGLNDDLTGWKNMRNACSASPISKRFTLNKGSIGQSHLHGSLWRFDLCVHCRRQYHSNEHVKAPWYKLAQDGTEEWINPIDSPSPEKLNPKLSSTLTKKNLQATNYSGDVKRVAEELDTFHRI